MQDAFDEEEEERAEENEQEKEGTNDEDLDNEEMLYWEVRIRFNIIFFSIVEPQVKSSGASDDQNFRSSSLALFIPKHLALDASSPCLRLCCLDRSMDAQITEVRSGSSGVGGQPAA